MPRATAGTAAPTRARPSSGPSTRPVGLDSGENPIQKVPASARLHTRKPRRGSRSPLRSAARAAGRRWDPQALLQHPPSPHATPPPPLLLPRPPDPTSLAQPAGVEREEPAGRLPGGRREVPPLGLSRHNLPTGGKARQAAPLPTFLGLSLPICEMATRTQGANPPGPLQGRSARNGVSLNRRLLTEGTPSRLHGGEHGRGPRIQHRPGNSVPPPRLTASPPS